MLRHVMLCFVVVVLCCLILVHLIHFLFYPTWGHSRTIICIFCKRLMAASFQLLAHQTEELQEITWLPGCVVKMPEISTWGAAAHTNALHFK